MIVLCTFKDLLLCLLSWRIGKDGKETKRRDPQIRSKGGAIHMIAFGEKPGSQLTETSVANNLFLVDL